MNENPKSAVVDPEKLRAGIRETLKECAGARNPSELFQPRTEVKIISKETDEHERIVQQRKDFIKNNPYAPPPITSAIACSGVNKDGVPEMRFATEEQLASRPKETNQPDHIFKVAVDVRHRQWGLRQGPGLKRLFPTEEQVVQHCRRLTKGERGKVEFFRAPTPLDQWVGDDFGDFLFAESW